MNPGLRVVLLLLVSSLVVGLATGAPFYYRLVYLWAFVLIGSWAMSKVALRGLSVSRTARSLRAQVGQVFEERFEVVNNSRLLHLWLEVRDLSPLPGAHGSQVLSLLRGHEQRTYLIRTRLLQRGVFPLGDTVLASGDPFGLFPVNLRYPVEDSLLVYPLMVEVQFHNPMGWLSGGEALRRRTHQITANAAGIREYEPGDSLNRIHWLSTARRNRLMSKEFELDPLADVWIFLDSARYVQASLPQEPVKLDSRDIWRPNVKIPMPPSTEEYGVSIAASLARYYLRQNRSVGFVSAGQSLQILPSDRGGRQLGKILEHLALLRAHGELPLQALVEVEARNLARGSTVVVITPATGDSVILSIELLMRRGLFPIAVILDAASFGGKPGTDDLIIKLTLLKVPVVRVANGDDLSATLTDGRNSHH